MSRAPRRALPRAARTALTALAGLLAAAGCGGDESGTKGPGAFGKPSPTVAKAVDGLPVEAWTARLTDPDPAARFEATVALAALEAAKDDAKDGLLACLRDPVATVRFGALDALGRVPDPDADVVLAALALLDDPDDGVRRHAKAVAIRWGVAALPALRARIASKDERVRRDVLAALAALGPDAAPAAPDLSALFAVDDIAAQDDAVEALAAMGAAGVPALVRGLADPRPDAAVLAAAALGKVGVGATAAVPDLAAGLKRGGGVRRACADALVEIGEPARGALMEAAKDADEAVREAAQEALDRLPKK